MKKLFSALILLQSVTTYSQSFIANYLEARLKLKVAGYEVSGIKNDTTFGSQSTSHLTTDWAMKNFVVSYITNHGTSTVETDPVWTAEKVNYLTVAIAASTYSPIGHSHLFSSITSKPTTLSGYGITDAYPLSGNPSGFLTSFSESDPVWTGIASTYRTKIQNDLLYYPLASNPSLYLTTEVDPVYSGSTWFSTTNNASNWNTAFGWGNHASAGYSLSSHTHTFASLTSKPTTIAGYGITDFNSLGDARWSLTSHNHTVDGLSNATITSKATGDLLTWNGSAWVNIAVLPVSNGGTNSASAGITALNNITGRSYSGFSGTGNLAGTASTTLTGATTTDTVVTKRINFSGNNTFGAINLNAAGTTAADGINFSNLAAIYRSSSSTITHSATITSLRTVLIETGAGIGNAFNTNKGNIQFLSTTGLLISTNIADALPVLNVQNLNATSTGDLLQLKNSASTVVASFGLTGKLTLSATNTATGTTGAQTINKPSGSVNFAAAASTLVVTNSTVTTSSLVFVQVYGTDATATSARVTIASGSFTITLNAAATAETKVGFFVIN